MNLARRRGGRYALPVTPPFEAGSATHSRRTLTCQERKMRVSSPAAARTATGVQSPLPRRRRTFHGGERRTRTVTLARSFAFEATPATLAGSLSTSALPPDANRQSNRPIEPFPSADLGGLPAHGADGRRPKGSVCARRELNPQHRGSRPGLSASWSTSTWSRHPVPTRIIRRTKAEPQPCAAAWFRDRDSNPNRQLQGLSSCRLDDPGSCTRSGPGTRTVPYLSSPGSAALGTG
jgi:hypothetical protein